MRSIIGFMVLALLGFYVAWPAYTGYRIKTALDTDNSALLASKIDFDSVRLSLKPTVSAEVEKAMTAAIEQGGGDNQQLLLQIKTQLAPKIIDTALAAMVTPETILRVHREGGDFKTTLAKIISEKVGDGGAGAGGGIDILGKIAKSAGIDPNAALGSLLGKKPPAHAQSPVAPSTASTTVKRPAFSMANIKSFSFNGPLGFSVGVAKDPSTALSDVTADLAFTGGDWKVVGVRPRV
jgi:hypothetical protein